MSKDVVAEAKQDLTAQGVDLSGPCGAYTITALTATRLGAGFGVFYKPTGNNCQDRAVDIVCHKIGAGQMAVYDCLIDAGGMNEPTWDLKGIDADTNFRDVLAVDPPPPQPEPPPVPLEPYPDENGWWPQVFDPTITADYAQAGQVYPNGPGAFRWAARTAFDIGRSNLTKEASMAKHRREWRSALGLPVTP